MFAKAQKEGVGGGSREGESAERVVHGSAVFLCVAHRWWDSARWSGLDQSSGDALREQRGTIDNAHSLIAGQNGRCATDSGGERTSNHFVRSARRGVFPARTSMRSSVGNGEEWEGMAEADARAGLKAYRADDPPCADAEKSAMVWQKVSAWALDPADWSVGQESRAKEEVETMANGSL